jgi:hypothetical protein
MKRKLLFATCAAALAVGGAAAPATGAFAKITDQCSNNGGHQAPGQQPVCTGQGQTQEAVNPQGKLPPGQQP